LGSKSKCRDYSDIKLNINGQVSRDKQEIAEVFGEYFATIADGIGQVDANKNSSDDFNDHSSVATITDSNPTDNELFKFLKLEQGTWKKH
jgi:hypothetical protein